MLVQKKFSIPFLVLFVALAIGCADPAKNAYTTLSASKTLYMSLMPLLKEMCQNNLITKEECEDYIEIARIYWVTHETGVDALFVYVFAKNEDNKVELIKAISKIIEKMPELERRVRYLLRKKGGI